MAGTVNEWYVFDAGTVDKKTCNKIKKWASKKWEVSGVDTKKGITDEGQIIPKSEYEPKDLTFKEHWNQAVIDHPLLKFSIGHIFCLSPAPGAIPIYC